MKYFLGLILIIGICGGGYYLYFKEKEIHPKRTSTQPLDETEAEVYRELTDKARSGDSNALIAALEKTNDPSRIVREGAANALGYFEDDKAFEALTVLLRDENANVRVRTTQAIGHIANPRRIDLLNKHLRSTITLREWVITNTVLYKMNSVPKIKQQHVKALVDFALSGDETDNMIAASKVAEMASNAPGVKEMIRQKSETSTNSEFAELCKRYLKNWNQN